MSSDKATLVVMVLSRDPEKLEPVISTIQEYYRSDVFTISESWQISKEFYANQPDCVLFDYELNDFKKMMRDNELFPKEMKRVPMAVFLNDMVEQSRVDLPAAVYGFLAPTSSTKDILTTMDRISRQAGYTLKTGEIDNRLVQRNVGVQLKSTDKEVLAEGETTGLDEETINARINLTKDDLTPDELEGKRCKVYFTDPDLLYVSPPEGLVKSVEPSWDDLFDCFISYIIDQDKVGGFHRNPQSKEILDELIESQTENSVRIKEQ